MVFGIIAAVSFGLCAAKFVTHRVNNEKLDKTFLKIHVAAGSILPVAAAVHTVKMFKKPHTIGQAATGLCIDAGVLGLLVSHFFSKPLREKSLPMHRMSTVIGGVGIAVHTIKNLKK